MRKTGTSKQRNSIPVCQQTHSPFEESTVNKRQTQFINGSRNGSGDDDDEESREIRMRMVIRDDVWR